MLKRKHANPLLISCLLVLSSLVALVGIVPVVHAWSIVNHIDASNCTSGVTCTGSIGSITSGNLLVVGVSWDNGASHAGEVANITDSRGNTFTQVVYKQGHYVTNPVFYFYAEIFVATIASSQASDTFTVTVTNAEVSSIDVQQVNGVNVNTVTGTGVCNQTCGGTNPTTSSVSFSNANDFVYAAMLDDCGGGVGTCVAAGAGFTLINVGNNNLDFTEFGATTGSVSSPSTFPFPNSGGNTPIFWVEVSAAFGESTVVTTVVAACNYFQLQCWWFPMLFMSLYSGFVMVVGTSLKVSSKGKAHIFLSAITFGSLVAVVLGVMNIMFPLLMLILNTAIAMRLR